MPHPTEPRIPHVRPPMVDSFGFPPERPRDFEAHYLGRFDGLPSGPRDFVAAIGPAEVLAAVAAMDDAQRARLARLLGVEGRHPLLYLPADRGGFNPPTFREAAGIPPGHALMIDAEDRIVGHIRGIRADVVALDEPAD